MQWKAEGGSVDSTDRIFLLGLQRRTAFFLDNQAANGLMLDRQANHGPRRPHGLCSLTSSGMGLIALALASAPPHRLLTAKAAAQRLAGGLRTVLDGLPHSRGVVPHFVHSATGRIHGADYFSTVESAWLVAGALGGGLPAQRGAGIPGKPSLRARRIGATGPRPRGCCDTGRDATGVFCLCCWDRLNGETAFMYILACGAEDGARWSAASWSALRPF